MTYVIAYISTLIAFFAIDIAWLGLIAKKFYAEQLGDMLLESPKWGVAIIFYLLYIAGIVFFAVKPALESETVLKATLCGALFGFFCYATILWGTVLTAACASVGAWVTLKFAT